MFIVNDEVLEQLICSKCKKYLSVKPIKIYPNRGIQCGRCSNPFDVGVASLFGVLAEEALFRCVNRYDGCNQLLTYSDVGEHEKLCVVRTHECPACIKSFKGTGYEVLLHFKQQHSNRLLLGNSEFVLHIDNEQYRSYLYQKNDLLFFVNASYYRVEQEIILSISFLGTDQDAAKISQMFTLLTVDEKIVHKTKKKPCCTEKDSNYFKVALNGNDFLKNVVICKFEVNTKEIDNVLMLSSTLQKALPKKSDKFCFNFGSEFPSSMFSNKPFSTIFPSEKFKYPQIASFTLPKFGKTTNSFNNLKTGTYIPYFPQTGTEMFYNGSSVDTKFCSITLMKEYEQWSFEELRLADYNANRIDTQLQKVNFEVNMPTPKFGTRSNWDNQYFKDTNLFSVPVRNDKCLQSRSTEMPDPFQASSFDTAATNKSDNNPMKIVSSTRSGYNSSMGSRETKHASRYFSTYNTQKVNAYELSDAELRFKLHQLGYPLMPVTATTRKVLRNKLNSLMWGIS